jgi:chloramphenicol 3-O-phosphotransferase
VLVGQEVGTSRSRTMTAVSKDAWIPRLILINGAPASGKSTLARRYVDDHHHGMALVEVDTLRMTLPSWEQDEATRLAARDLAGAAVVEHLGAGRDVVIAQYFGRLGYIVLLEAVAREHGATFVEVILGTDAALAIERFWARRRAMIDRGEIHPERDIADADVETFIVDAVDRLRRLPTARPTSRIIPTDLLASEHEIYRRLRSVLGEQDQP